MDMPDFLKRLLRREPPAEEVLDDSIPPEPAIPPTQVPMRKRAAPARPPVNWVFRTVTDAQSAIYALIIAGTDTERRQVALKFVAAQDGVPVAEKTRDLFKIAAQLSAADRMPYIEDALTRLKNIGPESGDKFLKMVAVLIDADKRYTLPEFTLNILLRSRLLKPEPAPTAKLSRQDVVPEMRILLSLMARSGADNEDVAARNLSRLMFQLTGQVADLAPAAELNINNLTAALEKMRQVPTMVRETFLQTLAECVALDGKVKPLESELLAAIAARLGVPVPPLDMSKLSRAET